MLRRVIVIYAWTRLEGNIVYGSHGPEMEYSAMRSAKLRDSLYEVFEA